MLKPQLNTLWGSRGQDSAAGLSNQVTPHLSRSLGRFTPAGAFLFLTPNRKESMIRWRFQAILTCHAEELRFRPIRKLQKVEQNNTRDVSHVPKGEATVHKANCEISPGLGGELTLRSTENACASADIVKNIVAIVGQQDETR